MTGLKGLLTLGLGLVTSLSMAATPAKPLTNSFQDVKVFMDAVHSGQIDPETYDFGAAGFYELEPMQRMHWQMLIFEVVTQSYPPSISECSRIRQQNGRVMAWTQIAAQSKDAADWKANAGMLGTRLATKQTGPEGLPVGQVYVEEGTAIAREIYISLTLNREKGHVFGD